VWQLKGIQETRFIPNKYRAICSKTVPILYDKELFWQEKNKINVCTMVTFNFERLTYIITFIFSSSTIKFKIQMKFIYEKPNSLNEGLI